MTAPVRRIGYQPEITSGSVPVNDNQLAPKGYVDGVALPTGGTTDYLLAKDTADRKGKWLPPHLAAAPLAASVSGSGGGATINVNSSSTGGSNIVMTTAGGITIAVPTNGFDMLVVHYTVYNNVGSTQNVTFDAGFDRLTGLNLVNALPNGKILRAAVRRTDVTGTAKWIIESIGITP